MSNTTDLFQPEFRQLSVPAATTAVFLDGALCDDLEPVELIRSGWPEYARARLAFNPAARLDTNGTSPERIEDRLAMGQGVRLCRLYNGAPPDAAVAGLPLFVGRIEAIETRLDSDGERVEVIAKDFSAFLRRITIYGRRVLQSDGSTVLLSGFDTIFNPLGEGNASSESVTLDGRIRTVFSASANGARGWSCADAINYLLCEYLPSGLLRWPSMEQLLALTESTPLRDLDLTGLSLLDALHQCCEQAGIEFQFVPRLAETGPSQAIAFSGRGQGRTVELNCQQQGESLSLSRTSVGALHSVKNFHPVTHRYIGQGDFKTYEATFDLVKAWDPALEDTDYGRFSASTNPEFHNVKDVYRKWCLNEAGDDSGHPDDQGPAYDFSRIFEHADYVQHRRRFWPALSTNAQGRPLGYFLQASFDDGLHWWQYRHAFNNLMDECGVWLSSDELDMDTWVAALKDSLRFRITACVMSDERLTAIIADGPVGSTIPVVDHVLTLPRQFRYRKVSAQSVLAPSSGSGLGRPDDADDSAALHQFVRQSAILSPAVMETTEVQTPSLLLHFEPGDRVISSPESKDQLSCRRDNRSTTRIERVHVDFRNQCTNLRLVRQRMYEGDGR
ncbi:MAG: hypothetical protein A2Y77_12570 [Planctomycetes bacterium RBG_13_62_9]|nr:MAG: hypothetical protein A2Y77_12570 [Planctomycetes bacterium RBG_13_62_9]